MELDPGALNELRNSCQGRNVDVRVTPHARATATQCPAPIATACAGRSGPRASSSPPSLARADRPPPPPTPRRPRRHGTAGLVVGVCVGNAASRLRRAAGSPGPAASAAAANQGPPTARARAGEGVGGGSAARRSWDAMQLAACAGRSGPHASSPPPTPAGAPTLPDREPTGPWTPLPPPSRPRSWPRPTGPDPPSPRQAVLHGQAK